MNNNVRYFEQITRSEWICWNWIYIAEFGDTRAKYIRGAEREVSEAEEAGKNFDIYLKAWRNTQGEK